MLPWWSPAPPDRRWRGLLLFLAVTHLLVGPEVYADAAGAPTASKAKPASPGGTAASPNAAPSPSPSDDTLTYLLTVSLAGPDGGDRKLGNDTLKTVAYHSKVPLQNMDVVQLKNISRCVKGKFVPAAPSEVFNAPGFATPVITAYLQKLGNIGPQHPIPNAGRRLLIAPSQDVNDCLPVCQITLQLQLSSASQFNSTLEFIKSGQYLAKMSQQQDELVYAKPLAFQAPNQQPQLYTDSDPDDGSTAGAPTAPNAGPYTAPSPSDILMPEFTFEIIGTDALVTNDVLMGTLHDMVTMPQQPASPYLSSEYAQIVVIKQGPVRSVSVGLGRRRLLLTHPRALRQVPTAAAFNGSLLPVNTTYNASYPSLDVTFSVINVTSAGLQDLNDSVTRLVSKNILVEGFQEKNISVNSVNLLSFSISTNLGQPPPAAQPPAIVITTRDGSSDVPKTIILATIIPVATLALIGCAVLLIIHYRNRRHLHDGGVSDTRMRLHAKESNASGSSSVSDHFIEKGESAADIIKSMHPDYMSQSRLMDMPWSDWKINPRELTILTKPDGSEWLLGSGASGKVFKALHNGVQIVAVKLFKEEMTRGAINSLTSPQHARQFRQEISILKSCHDKNIVQFLGACLTEGQTILVTEYLENGDLYNALHSQQGGRYHWYRMQMPDGRPVPNSGMARRVALDVARGLHFLHNKKIVHFDLKSANILLARDFTAKIADVGLARILHDDVLSTRREVGTFAWAAPEVLLGQRTTEAADIYSFGVLLHELSAIESPTNRQLRELRVPEDCPPEVDDLIKRCLSMDPAQRPSARDLVAQLSLLPAVPPFPPPPQAGRDSPAHSRQSSFHSFRVQSAAKEEQHLQLH